MQILGHYECFPSLGQYPGLNSPSNLTISFDFHFFRVCYQLVFHVISTSDRHAKIHCNLVIRTWWDRGCDELLKEILDFLTIPINALTDKHEIQNI